jgi:hypothetical protein
MILKCIALLAAALMLAGCCVSGIGCSPMAGSSVAGSPVAWDGLGTVPTETEDAQPPEPRKPARTKREIIVGPLDAAPAGRNNKVQPADQWAQQQAADKDEEARLKRQLVICRGCAAGETARDDTASANR